MRLYSSEKAVLQPEVVLDSALIPECPSEPSGKGCPLSAALGLSTLSLYGFYGSCPGYL